MVKILISSRIESDINECLKQHDRIEISRHKTQDDLDRFIETQVSAAVRNRRILPREQVSSQLTGKILATLKAEAHGMSVHSPMRC